MATHPDEGELKAYLSNRLSAEAEAEVAAHLTGGCPTCDPVIERVERMLAPNWVVPPSRLVRRIGRIGEPAWDAGPRPTVPGFAIDSPLGRGGMAFVYLARDRAGRQVALKVIPDAALADPDLVDRFEQESHLALALADRARTDGQAGLIGVYEIGQGDGVRYISMEFAAAGTMADRQLDLAADPVQAARLLADAADTVAWLNAQNPPVFHRDVKPSNLLLQGSAGAPLADLRMRLADFGLAFRIGDPQLTRTGETVGTLAFQAPELLDSAAVTPRTEVYALGATLYQLLSNRPPFASSTLPGLYDAIRRGGPARLGSGVPADLHRVCLRCLERDPTRRYATAADLAADLRRFAAGQPVTAGFASAPRRLVRWGDQNRTAVLGFVALTLTVDILAALLAASTARQAQRDDRYRSAIRASLDRGDGRTALQLFALAEADGMPITPEMRLDYIRGLAGVQDDAALRQQVEAVPLDGLPPALRGRYELWRARTQFGRDDAAAEAYLTAALSRPLPPAEREYAIGLRAATTPAAVAHFRAAIGHDRLFQPARSDACLYLYTLGRHDEAIALCTESAQALPGHPDFPIILSVCHALRGESERADVAVDRLAGLLLMAMVDAHRTVVSLLKRVRRAYRERAGYGEAENPNVLDVIAALRQQALKLPLQAASPENANLVDRLYGQLPPTHRERLRPYRALMIGNWEAVIERAGGLKVLEATAAAHPEGVLQIVIALAHYDQVVKPGQPPEAVTAALGAAARWAEAAAETPGMANSQDIALDLAIVYYGRLNSRRTDGTPADPAAGRRAVALLRRRRAAYGEESLAQCWSMARIAISAGDYPLAYDVLDGWDRRVPGEAAALRLQAELEFRSEAYPAAIRAADRVLARDRFDLKLHLLRWTAVVKMQDALAGVGNGR